MESGGVEWGRVDALTRAKHGLGPSCLRGTVVGNVAGDNWRCDADNVCHHVGVGTLSADSTERASAKL